MRCVRVQVCVCVCEKERVGVSHTHTRTHAQYNILVMVSKVRAMHRENPERTDEEMKEALIALMSNAGVSVSVSV
jgi:hypothetical protein